jgi:hypothetical protein
VTNSFRPGNPSTNRGNSQFGQINSAQSPRRSGCLRTPGSF